LASPSMMPGRCGACWANKQRLRVN
jgi:hypothetical protein